MKNTIRLLFATLLAISLSATAMAEDVVKLKSGQTYTGEVIEQTDDIIRIRVKIGGIEKVYILWANEVESIDRDNEGEDSGRSDPVRTDAGTSSTATTRVSETPAIDPNQKRVFYIPMHGMVGMKFRKDKLEQAIEAARKHQADIVVLEIESPGGLLSELYEIRDYISEIRNEFRVISWIKSAISAAAMTAVNTREIYFMQSGHMGAATAFYGVPGKETSLQGEELEEWLDDAREMTAAAGHSPLVAQAMIEPKYWLTADREELPTGEIRVTFYDTDAGENVLCRPGEILTLTASQAEEFGISRGTADTLEELAEKLNLDSWTEVSDEGRKIMESWFDTVDTAENEIPKLFTKYQYLSGRGAGSGREARRQLGEQANILREIIRIIRRDPAMIEAARFFYSVDVRDLERELRNIQRQLGG